MNEPHDPNRTVDVPSVPADSLEAGLAAGYAAPHSSRGGLQELRTGAEGDTVRPDADAAGADLPAVPGYRVVREIARGGMGRVLAAFDLGLDRDVALKVLLPGTSADRFVRESKITARLPHPGIPPVHELGALDDGSPFLAMKLIAGQTLAKEMTSADRPRLVQAFVQVCQAVGFAHSRGIIHRDLKPANVMMGAFGEVQVMDWGLAKDLTSQEVTALPRASESSPASVSGTDPGATTAHHAAGQSTDEQTQAGAILGTPAYMAPEQARGEPTDARSDVFALGGILCAILTGQPPFGGRSSAEIIQRAGVADLAEAQARLDGCGADAELVALCRRCLSPNPAGRPADGQAVVNGMTAYLNGVQERLHQAELAQAEARAKAIEEAKRRRLTVALAATVLLALTLGGGGWLYVKADRDARQAQLAREVSDALNRATALREQAKTAPTGGAALFAQAREQVQRAIALVANGPADDALKAQVARLQVELDAEEKDRELIAALDEARLAQVKVSAGANRWASEKAVPVFREAFRAYGLPAGEGEPAAVAERIRQRPSAVREALVAALDEWDALAADKDLEVNEPHQQWLQAVLAATEPAEGWTRQFRAAREEQDEARRRAALEKLAAAENVATLPVRALTRLARQLQIVEAHATAAQLLRRAQQQYRDDFWVNHDLGIALQQVTTLERDEAVRFLTAAVALRPGSPGAHHNLGRALWLKGQFDESIACCQKAIALDPKHARAYDGLGVALWQKGQFDESIASCRKAIELDSKFAQAHSNLGIALQTKGRVAEAIVCYKKAIELDPKDAYAHTNLGAALAATGRVDEAIACHRQAIEINPMLALAHNNLGNALKGKGQVDEAITCYRQAVEIDPKLAQAQDNLGLALQARGRLDEAIACHRKAIEINPKSAASHTSLGAALYSKGQLDEAITSFRTVIELNPRYAMAHGNLGAALAVKGQVDEAIASFKEAIALDPKLVGVHINLGTLLYGKGQMDEAIACYKKALEIDPKLTGARTQIANAERLAATRDKFAAFQNGSYTPANNDERLTLAEWCQIKKLPRTATRLYAAAFAADPKLADDLRARHRYDAACYAARAAAGRGEDAAKLDTERARLRKQALDWLRADLALRTKQLESGRSDDRSAAQNALQHWQRDRDLAGLRDAAALAQLPADEQQALTQLWADVAALLKKAGGKE